MSSEITEILIAAKEKIEFPEKWCQFQAKRGSRFCAMGAVYYTIYNVDEFGRSEIKSKYADKKNIFEKTKEVMYKSIPMGSISNFNDKNTHGEVMQMFDRAIAKSMEDEENDKRIMWSVKK